MQSVDWFQATFLFVLVAGACPAAADGNDGSGADAELCDFAQRVIGSTKSVATQWDQKRHTIF